MVGSASHNVTLSNETLTLSLHGRLDSQSTAPIWRQCMGILSKEEPKRVVIDAARLTYCDGAGIALFLKLRQDQLEREGDFSILHLQPQYEQLLDLAGRTKPEEFKVEESRCANFVEEIGSASLQLWEDFQRLLMFVGEISGGLLYAFQHPKKIRWRDVLLTIEKAGVNAIPIIALIGFLLGLIMAFQSAIPMRQFGADIFVANLIGLSMLRELGPLMTAIILAGRSGSAFAAELGTMTVREEIDALTTMGLEPVRFLIVPRVLAAITVTPLLTLFANLFGLIGGAIVMLSLGFPLITYVHQIQTAVTTGDMIGGLVKSLVFGIVIAGVGCLRGLQTSSGASAVGDSTTSAVVSGLILIAVVDGIFAIMYYALGI